MDHDNGQLRASILTRNQLDPLEYDEAYRFWCSEWRHAIENQSLRGLSVDASDKFVHSDLVLVFRMRDEIAGLGLISLIDLDFEADRSLSYLRAIPKEGQEFLAKHRVRKIMASAYNIVKPKFRRATAGRTLISLALPGFVLAMFERNPRFDLCMGMPLMATGNHRTLSRLGMMDMHEGSFDVHGTPAKFMYASRGMMTLGKYESDIEQLVDQADLSDYGTNRRRVIRPFDGFTSVGADERARQETMHA